MTYSQYQRRVVVSIDQKIIEYAMDNGKSLLNIDIMYNYNISEIKKIYAQPHNHLTKILVMAYNKTIKQYDECKNIN